MRGISAAARQTASQSTLRKRSQHFEPDLLYRGAADAEVQQEGTRRFIHPKLYRRQCTWWAYRKHGSFKSGFE